MRKQTRSFRRKAIVPLMRLFSAFMGPFSNKHTRALGRAVGLVAWTFNRTERKRAIKNLLDSFPEMDKETAEKIARSTFDNLSTSLLEALVLHRWPREKIRDLIVNFDEMRDLIRETRTGAVLVTAHIGNWELLAASFVRHGGAMHVVGKRMREDIFDDFLTKLRGASGLSVLYTDESPREMLGALKGGICIGILPDQDITEVDGVFVDFFGRPAYTPSAPAKLAIMSRKPIYVILLVREGEKYRLVIDGPFDPKRLKGREEREGEVLRLTEAWSRSLEQTVRNYPDQWVWMHRRWRNNPERLAWRRQQANGNGHSDEENETTEAATDIQQGEES